MVTREVHKYRHRFVTKTSLGKDCQNRKHREVTKDTETLYNHLTDGRSSGLDKNIGMGNGTSRPLKSEIYPTPSV